MAETTNPTTLLLRKLNIAGFDGRNVRFGETLRDLLRMWKMIDEYDPRHLQFVEGVKSSTSFIQAELERIINLSLRSVADDIWSQTNVVVEEKKAEES